MILIPAVDIREGRCVRLREGRADVETVFSDDPVAMAERWVAAGAERLHVVDLDGAFAGAPRQVALIAKIVEAVKPVPVEAGGGLRDLTALAAMFECGVAWAVVGTRAVVDAAFLGEACRLFPERIVVAADARGELVAIHGWTQSGQLTVTEVGRRARDAGATAVLYTDISRDGTELGPNLEMTASLARTVGMPVLASGGVGTIEHLRALAAVPGVIGTVIGRALYTGAVSLPTALAAVSS